MSDIAELRATIQRKEAWRAYYMAVLDLWAHAAEAGYTADQIKAFSYRPHFTPGKKRRWAQLTRVDDKTWHNCVRLHTGELKPIPLIERPQRPEGDEP
ncbi:MAG: hypothetical protein ACYS7Y_27385 [Planctomycetota bacterium]|jgi:hypothetical protein